MDNAADSGTPLVHGAVDYEAGLVDAVAGAGVEHHVAFEVNLHQARRGDLVVHQAIGVDEEMPFFARHAGRDVVIDEVVHPVVVDEPVAGGKIDTRAPFIGRYALAHRLDLEEGDLAHLPIMRRVTAAT